MLKERTQSGWITDVRKRADEALSAMLLTFPDLGDVVLLTHDTPPDSLPESA